VKLGCGTCINPEKQIERLESDLANLRGQLFIPDESTSKATEPKAPVLASDLARGREEVATKQANGRPVLRASSKEFVAKQRIVEARTNSVAVRGIQRPKYSSTCYINAAVQALFHVQGFSDFLESNSFSKDHHPLLLQLQKLYGHCRSARGGR
jgi:hypothetical protein